MSSFLPDFAVGVAVVGIVILDLAALAIALCAVVSWGKGPR